MMALLYEDWETFPCVKALVGNQNTKIDINIRTGYDHMKAFADTEDMVQLLNEFKEVEKYFKKIKLVKSELHNLPLRKAKEECNKRNLSEEGEIEDILDRLYRYKTGEELVDSDMRGGTLANAQDSIKKRKSKSSTSKLRKKKRKRKRTKRKNKRIKRKTNNNSKQH